VDIQVKRNERAAMGITLRLKAVNGLGKNSPVSMIEARFKIYMLILLGVKRKLQRALLEGQAVRGSYLYTGIIEHRFSGKCHSRGRDRFRHISLKVSNDLVRGLHCHSVGCPIADSCNMAC